MKYRDIVANKQTFVQLLRCINASMDFALNSRLNVRFILVLFRYSVNKQISNEKNYYELEDYLWNRWTHRRCGDVHYSGMQSKRYTKFFRI